MEKLFAVLALFRRGNEVADPALWKTGGMAAMAFVPFLLALDRVGAAFGLPLGISESAAADVSAGIVAAIGVVSHLITSKKVGLPAEPASGETTGPADGFRDRGP